MDHARFATSGRGSVEKATGTAYLSIFKHSLCTGTEEPQSAGVPSQKQVATEAGKSWILHRRLPLGQPLYPEDTSRLHQPEAA